jgi:DNA helicase HerA-like ATPase
LEGNAAVLVSEEMLRRHTLVFGSSGFGKTRFLYHLIREQMRLHGASLFAIDPEPAALKSLRGVCHELKVPAERVVMVDPGNPDYSPPMNLFRSGMPPGEVASQILELMEISDTAVRVHEFLINSLNVVAWHGLFLSDVMRLLKDETFRGITLSRMPLHPVDEVYE